MPELVLVLDCGSTNITAAAVVWTSRSSRS